MTLRLPLELAESLATVARIEGLSQAAIVRRALDLHLSARATEPEFVALCKASRDDADEALRALLRAVGLDPDQPLTQDDVDAHFISSEQVPDYLADLGD